MDYLNAYLNHPEKIVANSASKSKHLKLYTEQPPKPIRPQIESLGCMPELLRAFQTATGWSMQYKGPAASHKGLAASAASESKISNLQISKSPNPKSLSPTPIDRDAAQRLAGSIAEVLDELFDTRDALHRREAELAAGVPLVPHRREEKHLAMRLEAVLRAGVEAVGCDAAALYMLDEATSELKMRSSCGLPFDRLTAPPRPLEGALADLEALLGHAVVLDDSTAMRTWNMPENFPAAVCVPVSTPTTLLGTLWVFANQPRDFNDRETNLLEVIAGRLAADLEREMLLRTGVDGAKLQQQIAAAERLQCNELPAIAPMLDGWNLAGRTIQSGNVGGAFHDWFSLPDGLTAVAVGRAAEQGVAGALTAGGVKTALRSHAKYQRQVEPVMQQVNLTLWTGSAGDRHAALLFGLIETATGRVCCASAGRPSAILLSGEGWQSLGRSSVMLGESPETRFEPFDHELQPGEALVFCTDGALDVADAEGRILGEAGLADALRGKLELAAEELVAAAQAALENHAPDNTRDHSILVVKRTMS